MYAVRNWWLVRRRNARRRLDGGVADVDRVLPRVLRWPTRYFTALVDGRVVIPPHTGTLAAAALFAMTGLYGVMQGGHLTALADSTTSVAGFAIERVEVDGNVETSPIDIVQELGLDGHTSLITLDLDEARQSILNLPWVREADIRKIYPDVVDVKLSERRAFGIWQHGQELSLIEKNGNVIAPLKREKFTQLPLYVGLGAGTNAAAIDTAMNDWPELKLRTVAYIRVADRRWDIRLDNGITVMLPQINERAALAKLRRLDHEMDLFGRDISTVDMRLEDRITVGLTDRAMERRDNALQARERMLKKRGRSS